MIPDDKTKITEYVGTYTVLSGMILKDKQQYDPTQKQLNAMKNAFVAYIFEQVEKESGSNE